MNDISLHELPTPVRALLTDEPIELLTFAADAFKAGQVAIATLVEIRGGARRVARLFTFWAEMIA